MIKSIRQEFVFTEALDRYQEMEMDKFKSTKISVACCFNQHIASLSLFSFLKIILEINDELIVIEDNKIKCCFKFKYQIKAGIRFRKI